MTKKLKAVAVILGVPFIACSQPTRPNPPASTESSTISPPAWQSGDETLARKWKEITGRYIFQQACTECHNWGPNYWPRSRWETYLTDFPANHKPDVRERYRDLTGMFEMTKMVPNLAEERDA